jgi:hypothetical protein
MVMTSAAEEKLNARIRPDIAAMRSRTPYPKRRLSVVPPVDSASEAETAACAIAASPVTAAASPVAALPSPVAWPGKTQPAGIQSAGMAPAGRSPQVSSRPSVREGAVREGSVPVGSAPAGSAPAGPVRLTRRGRIVVGTLVVIAVVVVASVIWLLIAGQAVASDHAQSGHVTTQSLRKVVVRPGQTLWGIAVAADPTADPRAVVQEIIDENTLAGTTIQAGQVLWVPRG